MLRKKYLVSSSTSRNIAGFDIRTRAVPALSSSIHDNPLLNRLYCARGIVNSGQLDNGLSSLIPFSSMKGLDDAVQLLQQARRERWKVLIVGDYDTDGATSTALAMLGLTSMGIDVQFLLPNRFEYGYGLSVEIVELALTMNPDLILTVDNGIASLEGVYYAQSAGVKVLITDHHLPGDQVPDAEAIVNPNQVGCEFPSKAACGCTVLYYLLIALRSALRDEGVADLPNLGQWLDLVSLATVADVVPLDENNRRLVQQGLNRVRAGKCRPGIKAIFDVAGRSWQEARSTDFGFVVGPRLNAAGRLDDMTIGVQLLLAESEQEAHYLAAQLQDLNQERRQIEASMLVDVEKAFAMASDLSGDYGVVVFGDGWHEGVIGILASRVKDKMHRPVIAFAESDQGLLKGSGRSISGVHLRDCLDWVSKQKPDLIVKFGGHAMAAGLTIAKADLSEFQIWFNLSIQKFSNDEALVPHLWTDGELLSHELTLENALLLESAGPWGQAFPEPSFVGQWSVKEKRILGGKHLKLTVISGQQEIPAIAFNVPEEALSAQIKSISAVYQLNCNRFRGETSLQLMLSKFDISPV